MIAASTYEVIPLSPWQVALAAGLVLVVGVISVLLRLRVESQLALASVRMVAQLVLIGFILEWVFAVDQAWIVLAISIFMTGVAAHAAVKRSSRTFRGLMPRAFGALLFSGLTTTFLATTVIIRTEPWFLPQYFIPLLGMVLGNSLNGISLGVDTLLERFKERAPLIEMDLAHGATRWEAARDHVAEAVRRGLLPIINTMSVVGLVSLPGMMTGQIIAGAPPLQAVKYQLVIIFMIAAATALGAVLATLAVYRYLFTHEHRLRSDLIEPR